MTVTKRIELTSDFWVEELTSDMDAPRPALKQLMEMDKPTADAIEYFLDGLYYVDYPIPQFLLTIPYLLDLFEKQPKELVPVIIMFCNFLHKCKDAKPGDRYLEQLEASRERIFNLLVNCLSQSKGDGYSRHQQLIAGLATACDEPDLGRQIVGLSADTMIN